MLKINKTCCFFGHRDAPEHLKPKINLILKL